MAAQEEPKKKSAIDQGGEAVAGKVAEQAANKAATAAAASTGVLAPVAPLIGKAAGWLGKKIGGKLIWGSVKTTVQIGCGIVLFIIIVILVLIAAIAGGLNNLNNKTDGEVSSKTQQYLTIKLTAQVCDLKGEKCTNELGGVSGEKLIIYSADVAPTGSLKIHNVKLTVSFPEGFEFIDKDLLKLGVNYGASFYDSTTAHRDETSIKLYQVDCNTPSRVADICFGVDELSGSTIFTYTVKTTSALTAESVITTEVEANGGIEGFSGKVDPSDIFKRYGSQSGPIKAQKLIDLFNEFETLTGVPACAFAGIAAIESHDFFFNALDSHDAFDKGLFVTSPNHAVGLMQVSTPGPGTVGNVSDGALRKGAAFAGRSLDEMLAHQYEMRTNLYFGAGYLMEKLGSGDWSNIDDVYQVGCRYYGRCTYGGFAYADNFKENYLSCESNNPSSSRNVNLNANTSN